MRSLDCELARLDRRIAKNLHTMQKLRLRVGPDLERTIHLTTVHLRKRIRRLMRKSLTTDQDTFQAVCSDLALLGAQVVMRRFIEQDIQRRNES